MVDYVLEGPRWGGGSVGSYGGVITWAIDSSVPASFAAVLTQAFADWASHANIAFREVASAASAQIDFSLASIDGLNNTLGVTDYAYSGSQFQDAAITFDSGEDWHSSGSHIVSDAGIDLFVVALHEIGHAIGLDHDNAAPAIMNAILNRSVTDLTASDVDGAQALYGAPPLQGQTAVMAGTVHADFNGDRLADILWRNDNGEVGVWSSTGSSFQYVDFGNVAPSWTAQEVADFGGDGKADILWRNTNGDAYIWNSTGPGFSGQDLGIVGNDWHIKDTADFNGDGKADIMWRNDNGELNLWTSTGPGFSSRDFGNVSNDWHIQDGAADFNGDGKSDLLWRNDNGELNIWTSTGSGFSSQDFGHVGNDWAIKAVGDLMGDGKSDILWQNANGDVNVWTATGAGFSSQDFGVVGPAWQIKGIENFDGAGKSDILWRNTTNGDVYDWASTGSGFQGHDLGIADLHWTINAA